MHMQRAHTVLASCRAIACTVFPRPVYSTPMSSRGKRKATKVAAPEVDEDDVVEVEIEEDEARKKPAAKKAKAAPKITEPCTDELGWEIVPPSLIWRDFGTEPSEKIAAIDMDGTLVKTKTGQDFPVDAGDWRLFNDNVPAIVQGFHKDGYKIVVFSNQGAIRGALVGKGAANQKNRFAAVIKKLGVPVQAFMATQKNDPMRKPETGMWTKMTTECNGGVPVDLQSSFYIGDAAGRNGDHSTADKEFADNVGIAYKLPEDVFGPEDKKAAGGSGGGGAGPVANEANAAIIKMFSDIAEYWAVNGKEDKDKFKASANRKVARALATFEQPITQENLKEVNKLAGIGKASMDKALEAAKNPPPEDVGAAGGAEGSKAAPPKPSKEAQVAAHFM